MNKGFSLLEMLITLMIISSLSIVTLNRINNVDMRWSSFINEYLLKQSSALVDRQGMDIDGYPISFNSNGRVNQARTITISNKNLVIHLGNGYLTVNEE